MFYPWLGAAPKKFCAGLSTLFFLGALPAPGTWGSAAGSLFAAYCMARAPLWAYILISVLIVYLAIGICDVGEKYFKAKDPGKINLDEFAAMPICYFGVYFSGAWAANFWWWILGGFLLFRFFDIIKPLGIKRVQVLDGGLGCVLDDILAGILTGAILYCASLVVQ